MKKLLFILLMLFAAIPAFAQSGASNSMRYYGARSTAQEPATCSTAIGGIYYNTTEKSFYQCTDTNTWTAVGAGGGGGMAIGVAVTGGTECRVLYIDASGNLAQDAGLCYDASTDRLNLTQGNTAGILIGTAAGTFGGRILRSNTGSMLIGIADSTEFSVISQGGSPLLSLDSSGNGSVTGSWTVADDAYDATSWNDSLEVPTKNAIRDKIETLGGGASSPLTLTASSASEIPLTLKGTTSQTGNLLNLTNVSDTVLTSFLADGRLEVAGGSISCSDLAIQMKGFATTGIAFQAGSNIAGICIANSRAWLLATDGMNIASNAGYNFNSSTANNAGNDTGLSRFSAGVVKLTDASTGIRALQGGGAAVASATALPLPTGRVFHVTGTTNITSITATNFQSGVCITLIFDGVLTFTDGNNLKLAGDFVTTADDTISLCYDGTSFFETSRSVN